MATLGIQILPTGPLAPSYADILQALRNSFWSIYGSDADLDDDSQDGQMLAVFAQTYPAFESWMSNTGGGDFEQEVNPGAAD